MLLAGGDIGIVVAPAPRPVLQVRTNTGQAARRIGGDNRISINFLALPSMLLTRLLNACSSLSRFRSTKRHWLIDRMKTIEIDVAATQRFPGLLLGLQ